MNSDNIRVEVRRKQVDFFAHVGWGEVVRAGMVRAKGKDTPLVGVPGYLQQYTMLIL